MTADGLHQNPEIVSRTRLVSGWLTNAQPKGDAVVVTEQEPAPPVEATGDSAPSQHYYLPTITGLRPSIRPELAKVASGE